MDALRGLLELQRDRLSTIALAGGVGATAGAVAASSTVATVTCVVLSLGFFFLAAPPVYWALAAVLSAVVLPGLQSLHLSPGFGSYLHFPLVFVGFLVAIVRYDGSSRLANRLVLMLCLLAFSCLCSTLFAQAEPVRGMFSFALLGEPLALLGIFMMAPPRPGDWRNIRRAMLAVVLVQIPVAYGQVAHVGFGSLFSKNQADSITGTVGIAGGGDVLAAIAVIGVIWLLSLPRQPASLVAAAALLPLPLFAAAYKVLLAIPAVVLASPTGARLTAPVRAAVIATSITVVVLFASVLPAYVLPSLEGSLSSKRGKGQALAVAWEEISREPDTLAFGAGPASTVSGAAYLTTDPLKKDQSPIRILGIAPSETAIRLGALEPASSSFNRPRSSLFGTLGDLGILGFVVYATYLFVVFSKLYRLRSPEGTAAAAGMIFVLLFGLIETGWELPALTLFAAALSGLAVTASRRNSGHAQPHDHLSGQQSIPSLHP